MEKKKPRKLTLCRETIRTLEDAQLRTVVGGGKTDRCSVDTTAIKGTRRC